MPPANLRFDGGPAHSTLHPIAFVAMLLAILLILFLPRRYAIVPFLFCAILIPLGQQVVVGGIHLMVLRILLLAGLLRMSVAKLSSRGGILPNGFGSLDRWFTFWAIFAALAPILLFRQTGAIVHSCGLLLDTFGGYFLLRYLIRDKDDVYRVIRTFGWVAVILALGMSFEQLYRLDVFGFIGSVPLESAIRDGRIRAQGPFVNPILAGCFGATLLPLFYLSWKTGKGRLGAAVGAISSTFIVVASASSTPLLAYVGGIFAICLFPLRRSMRAIRWGLVLGLISLQLVMKAPVWFAITHFHFVGGSSNYHRAELVQMFVTHFSDWWLVGTKANASWGWDMWDMANQFIAQGETGGLATLLCFVAIITVCFKWIGKARKQVEGDRRQEWFFWLLGAALFANVVAFFGISYFDQTVEIWFVLLALIAAATMPVLSTSPVPERSVNLPARPSRQTYRPASIANPSRKGAGPLISQ